MIKLNGVAINPTQFPDKTSQVWKLPEDLLQAIYKYGQAEVVWEFENEAEFMALAQLKTLLDTYVKYVDLYMPYLPYARQDKRIENTSTFALHTFAALINSLKFTNVRTLDAHNNMRANMIENLEDRGPKTYIENVIEKTNVDTILYPDEGAKTRYSAYRFVVDQSIYADKVRDQSTGRISSIKINGKIRNKRVLIVDDICDGGMTFILIAKQALEDGAKEVHLFVTHGIFSAGLQPLIDAGIERVFTHKGEVVNGTVFQVRQQLAPK